MKRLLSRPLVGLFALALLGAVVIWDATRTGLPEPFRTPAPFALGSGAAPEGAHCTGS